MMSRCQGRRLDSSPLGPPSTKPYRQRACAQHTRTTASPGSRACSLVARTTPRPARQAKARAQSSSGSQRGPSSWELEDEWGRENETTWEDDLGVYFDESDELSSYGYELIAGALSASLLFLFFKVLLSLIAVCWALISTAFQYSIVAFVMIALIVFIG